MGLCEDIDAELINDMIAPMHNHPSTPTSTSKRIDWKKQDVRNLKEIIEQGMKTEPYAFTKHTYLGVPVYVNAIPSSACIHIRVGFKYGAIHDEPGKEGTAHFLEHMLFDGSSMFADEKETQDFSKTILLDTLNAYTSLFELVITGKTLPHHFNTAIAGIFSMINAPLLTERSFEHEKKVITQEAWGRFLNEKRVAYLKKEKENIYYDLPDRARTGSALGWPETVLAITHEDILRAHATYFVRENMEIYLAGNLDAVGGVTQVLDLLAAYITETNSGTEAKRAYVPTHIGAPKIKLFDHTFEEAGLSERQQVSIDISSMIPRINTLAYSAQDTDAYRAKKEIEGKHGAALTLAGSLIGDIVFRRLRLENSWCYGAGADINLCPDHLTMSIGASIDKRHTEEAITIIWEIIDDVIAGKFTDDFIKTKAATIDSSLARERTTGKILDAAMESVKFFEEIITLRTSLDALCNVTYEDVQDILRTYMRKDIVFTEILRPKEGGQEIVNQ